MENMVVSSVRRKRKHCGARNTHKLVQAFIDTYGARPDIEGLKGPALKSATEARGRWDAALKAHSPVIAQAVDNGVCRLNAQGFMVRA